mgnify:CR=1 FL=1
MKKVPLVVGFIFPNGRFIQTGGIGHCRCAMRYIIDNNLYEKFKESNCTEDDFLIEYLGVAKVAHWRGMAYLFLPKHSNWYISEIKKIYEKAGYKIFYCHNSANINIEKELIVNTMPYNQTVCKKVDESGEIIYTYNPNRIGD